MFGQQIFVQFYLSGNGTKALIKKISQPNIFRLFYKYVMLHYNRKREKNHKEYISSALYQEDLRNNIIIVNILSKFYQKFYTDKVIAFLKNTVLGSLDVKKSWQIFY